MRKLAGALAVAAVLLLTVASAASAATDPRVPGLQRQVTALKRQLAVLTSAVIHDEDLATCRSVYQSHVNFGMLDLWAILLGEPQPADTTGSDNGACSRVGIAPPTSRVLASRLDPFGSLVALQLQLTKGVRDDTYHRDAPR